MPSSTRSSRSAAPLDLVLVALFTVLARLPFLVRGNRFFDADEAVEGLMARHVWQGELPAFLWGQRYKGVPEVYLTATLFRIGGSSVIALKAATLICFVAFACLQFVLIERLFSRRIAWLTILFTIAAAPAFVLWSLSGNAEVVMTLLAATLAGLGFEKWQRTNSGSALALAAGAVGAGLWIQQYIVYYLVALAVLGAARLGWPGMKELIRADDSPRPTRWVLHAVAAVALLYFVLGCLAFATGGFDITLAGLRIGLRHPQKLWRVCGGLLSAWAALHWMARGWLTAFLIGYSPAALAQLAAPGGAPVGRVDAYGVAGTLRSTFLDIMPIVFGFQTPTTERLAIPTGLALVVAAVVVVSYAAVRDVRWPRFFHVLVVIGVLLFVLSGAFVDAQSYRYLMPLYGALPVVYAVGVDGLGRWRSVAGVVACALLAGLFAMEQVLWYRRLEPDAEASAAIRCLDDRGQNVAFADYWLSYRVTFLTGERIIVAPNTGVDRYPPFTERARAGTRTPTVGPCPNGSGTMPCCP